MSNLLMKHEVQCTLYAGWRGTCFARHSLIIWKNWLFPSPFCLFTFLDNSLIIFLSSLSSLQAFLYIPLLKFKASFSLLLHIYPKYNLFRPHNASCICVWPWTTNGRLFPGEGCLFCSQLSLVAQSSLCRVSGGLMGFAPSNFF